jgi:phage baseplate assembly protein gpV|tara:strand:+ start:443 stop:1171 length:729 start_codon:yes stop_codon:yes gene_type:complete
MASSFSTNSKLELVTTGEKAGLWGTITNTNLQILEQLSTGYLSLAVGSSDQALALDNGATSNGKNIYIKLTGTLAANRTVTIPDTAERVMVFEDATTRESSGSIKTLTIKTVSGSGVTVPSGATVLVYSDGTNINLGMQTKGYLTVNSSTVTAYTASAGEQIFANTTANPITITLPTSPATGDEITFIDARGTFNSNNLILNRNGQPINTGTSNLTLTTNGQAFTLVYVDSTRGWAYKTNTA